MRPYFWQEVLYVGLIQSSIRRDLRSWVTTCRDAHDIK